MNKLPGFLSRPTLRMTVYLTHPEAAPKIEGSTPGPLSVDGFGLECWGFEDPEPDEIANEVKLCTPCPDATP